MCILLPCVCKRKEKAFSPTIAALILMILTVAVGVLTYGYVMGWLGESTDDGGMPKGGLQIEALYADADADRIKIYIRNIGNKILYINRIYVNGVSYENITSPIDARLEPQEIKYLEISVPLHPGYSYEVKIVCSDGTMIALNVQAR